MGKRASEADEPRTGNVRPDPIWIQSGSVIAAPDGSPAALARVEPDAVGPREEPDEHPVEPDAAPARTLPPPARVAMVRALAEGMAESFAAGDLEAVRLALDTIGRFVGR